MELSAYTPEEPIAAIATAFAPAALAIVRASGKNAIERAARVFSHPERLLNAKGGTIHHGWIHAFLRTCPQDNADSPSLIDEVMAAVYRAPHSFTGEDSVELFCHGGLPVVKSIYELLLAQGFREALPGEFTFRAFINGKTDLTRAEAIREITESKTLQASQKAAARLAGTLREELASVKNLLLDALAAIEAEIEYPEDEHAFADGKIDVENLAAAKKKLDALCDSWVSEKLYQEGARVVLCGKTNAGKSSLFNAILKEDRAIVSTTHGTTRDWIEGDASFGGVPVTLFDTAGIRDTFDAIEREGVDRAKNLIAQADVVVYVIDSAAERSREDADFIATFEKKFAAPLIIALNKNDVAQSWTGGGVAATDKAKFLERRGQMGEAYLPKSAPTNGRESRQGGRRKRTEADESPKQEAEGCSRLPPSNKKEIFVSAKTGEGISNLVEAITRALGVMPHAQKETAALGSARQKKACEEALDSVRHALASADGEFALDAVADDIEGALYSLREITGEVTPDNILDTVFSKFCLGK